MEKEIRKIVNREIADWLKNFEARHIGELNDPEGVINSKVNNIFIADLGKEICFYSALSRSLDSSLGNTIEKIAIEIAKINFEVSQQVEGVLYTEQTRKIGVLLEKYKNSNDSLRPSVKHYEDLWTHKGLDKHTKVHNSDYMLVHRKTGNYSLIELKLGGDLDNKKARSEKEALLEQYCILINKIGTSKRINLYFATGYNKFGEGNEWRQGRVLQFFADEELLISSAFWNFVSDSPNGYEIVLDEYNKNAKKITDCVMKIKSMYLD